LDREIDRLQKQVDSGTMKLVDEKKALSDISGYNRAKKSFATFNSQQKGIDEVKAQIADLKKTGDNPEAKALSDRYNEIQKQLDEMKKETDGAFKNLNALRDERTKASNEQNEAYNKWKDIKDKYHQARRAFNNWEFEQKKKRREAQQVERAAYESGKRREVAQRKLEEASSPAYGDELITAENLIRHFDPSSVPAKEEKASSTEFTAVASRTVEDGSFKGMKVVKKEEEDYFGPSGGKKKKGKKTGETAKSGKFQLSSDVIESLAKIGVDPPAGPAHVPIVINQIKEKITFWKSDQKRKTEEVCLH
jgi:chromosome segregation ATPase